MEHTKEPYKRVLFDTLKDGDKFNRKIEHDMAYFERQIQGDVIIFVDGVETVGETVDMWRGDMVYVKTVTGDE